MKAIQAVRPLFIGLLLTVIGLLTVTLTGTAASIPQQFTDFQSTQIRSTYIVVLKDTPLASYRGGVANLRATNPKVRGVSKLDVQSVDSVAYLDYLDGRRAQTIGTIESQLGRNLDIPYEYKATINGFATQLTAAEAAEVEKLDNVPLLKKRRCRISKPTPDPIGSMPMTFGQG